MDSKTRNSVRCAALSGVFFIFASQTSVAAVKPNVVYGDDNRVNFSEITDNAMRETARATAAMVYKKSVKFNGDRASLSAKSLGQEYNLCSDERYFSEPTPAICSGFLVGPDLLVTAGHCVKSDSECQGIYWAFDFTDQAIAGPGKVELPAASVFACKKVLDRQQTSSGLDYAVLQLERAVSDREPLRTRKEGAITPGEELVVIGYPSGLPLKAAGGARVRSTDAPAYFSANLDTFAGNSGSAVFNQETGLVEGILVRGATDYVYDTKRKCTTVNHCTTDGCGGEEVTKITQVPILNGGIARPPK